MHRTVAIVILVVLLQPEATHAQADVTIAIVESWQRGDSLPTTFLELSTRERFSDRCMAAHDSLSAHSWLVTIDSVYSCNHFGIGGPATARLPLPATSPENQFLLARGAAVDRYYFVRKPAYVSLHSQRSSFSRFTAQPDVPAPRGTWYGQSKALIEPGMWLVQCDGPTQYRVACPAFVYALVESIEGEGRLLVTYQGLTPPFFSSYTPLDSLTRVSGTILLPRDSANVRRLHELSEDITDLLRGSGSGLRMRLLSWKGAQEFCWEGRCRDAAH